MALRPSLAIRGQRPQGRGGPRRNMSKGRRQWMRIGALAGVAAMAAFALAACGSGSSSSSSSTQGGDLNFDETSFPDYLDPQLSYTVDGWEAEYNTYIPLLTF